MSTAQRGPGTAAGGSSRVKESTVLAVAAFGAFLAFLDATVVNVAFPDIRASFPGASLADLSWVLNAYNIVLAAAMVVFGRLADLVGRRRLYLLGIVVFTAASVACAAAGSVLVLVLARGVQALGAAMLVPSSLALVIEAFPPGRRAHAVGLWGASAAAAAGLGPPIGGALVEWGSWRWAFLVNLPVGLVALLVARRGLVESRRPGRRRLPDLLGAVLLAVALGLLTTAIVTGNDWGWGSARVIGCFAGAAVAAAGFVLSSRVHPSPLVEPALLRVRAFSVANLASAVAGMGFYAYLLTNVLWLQYVWGYDVLTSGLALVPAALVAAVVAGTLGPLAERRGFRLVVVPGALVWAGAYLWYAVSVGTEPAFLTEWLPGQVLSGIGVGATLPILGSAALASVPGGGYATASAVNSSARQLGGVIGIALLVVVIGTPAPEQAADAFRDGWLLTAGCFVVTAVLAVAMGRVRSDDAGAAPAPDAAAARVARPEGTVLAAPAADEEDQPLMTRLGPEARAALEAAAERVELAAGEVLFRAGDPADAAYSVVSGRLEVDVAGVGVRRLGPGAVIGELALLTAGTRSGTVTARRDSVLLRLLPESLDAALQEHPAAGGALARVLAGQLVRPATPPRDGSPTTLAVVGLHRGAPTAAVAEALTRALSAQLPGGGPVTVLGSVAADGLARAEQEAARVLLVADDPGVGHWASSVRQADGHVLVASADRVPDDRLPAVPPGADVVLVGNDPGQDAVVAWTEAVDAWQVTRVAVPGPEGLRPLAARLAGRSLGLVLAGGGARALSHLGVLEALEEAQVPVDRVAGTSIGGIVAALHGSGRGAAEVKDVMYAEFVRRKPFADYTVPRVALAKGQRARAGLRRHFGDLRIEAMPRQFRCVSVDLLTRDVVVHRRGPAADALLATIALPGLLPPVRSGGRILVDGGVLANLPVPALQERHEGPLVAVNVGMGGSERPAGTASSRPPRMPLLGETLLRTMLIGSGGAVAGATASGVTVVTPPSMGVGLLEFHQFDLLVEAGLAAGRRLVEDGTLADLAGA